MTGELLPTLLIAAASIGALHSFAPDHWVPIAAVSRARGWSPGRTARVAALCGIGHVTVSVLLGLLGLLFGVELLESVGQRLASVAGLILIGFGTTYAVWGMRRALKHRGHAYHRHGAHHHGHAHEGHHTHEHHRAAPDTATTWSLFVVYCADPCVAVVPLLFASAMLPLTHVIAVVLTYELSTVATMVGLVALSRAGAGRLRFPWIDRYGDGAAGGLIVAVGALVMVLGW